MKDATPIRPAPPNGELPDVLLERYLLGELPAAMREPIEARLGSDAALRARLQSLEHSNREVLARYPGLDALPRRAPRADAPRAAATRPSRSSEAGILGRLRETLRPGGGFPWVKAALPVFATLALVAVAVRHDRRPVPDGAAQGNSIVTETAVEPGIRIKGLEAGLAIYRKSRGGIELVPPQGAVRPGDTLQICYQSFKDLHGMIFSVDGRGSVTMHLPEEDGSSVPLAKGGLQALPHAYLLDQAPRMERFYLITSPRPFPADSVLASLRPALLPTMPLPDSLEGLPAGFSQSSYTLRKEEAARPKPRASRTKESR